MADDTRDELEVELARLGEQLRPGGTQAVCEELRARIAAVRAEIARRERTVFVRDSFMDD
jgi:hypothetical protein